MSTKSIQSNTRKVPELRFPGFEGEWKEKRLGEVATFLKGKGISKDEIGENYRNKCIHYGELYTRYGEVIENVISRTNFPKEKSVLSKENDTLMPTSDVTPKGLATASSLKEPGVILGGDILVIRSDHILNSFLSYYIEAHKKDVMRLVSGVTVYHIYGSDLKTLKIFIPPLSEQQKIASLLINVDKYILNLRLKKESLETYKKGMMQKIFSHEVRFKDDKGKEFTEWQETKLGEVAEIVGGGTPDTTKNEYWNGQINWFTPTEISKKYATVSLRKISEFGLKNSSTRLLPIGTLLFTSRAIVGDISISTIECCTNQGFQSFIINDQNYNNFFYYWILHYKNEFLRRANGSTFLEISGKEIRKIKVSSPSFSEQRKIGGFLSSLDDVIESMQQQINLVEQWKKSLMQRLFV